MKLASAVGQERLLATDADFFQRFQAVGHESRADDVDPVRPGARELDQRRLGVRLQPLRAAEPRLECQGPFLCAQIQRVGQQPRGLVALAMVGVAALERVARQPVEAHHQHGATAVRLPVLAHERSQRLDISIVVVKVLDEPGLGNVARPSEPIAHRVHHARRRAGGVLRVERQHDQALAAGPLEAPERAGDRRFAVAHREFHERRSGAEPSAQAVREERSLPGGMDGERRAARSPDFGVLASRASWPNVQDDAVQDRKPERARNLDDSRVRQEFAQVAADRSGRRRHGRSQIDEQHRVAFGTRVVEFGFGTEARHRGKRIDRPAAYCDPCDRALDTSFAVMSTIGMTLS